jgi:hypothetical protein
MEICARYLDALSLLHDVQPGSISELQGARLADSAIHPRFLLIIVVLVFSAMFYEWMPALLFVTFLLYGFVRPFISRPAP